MYSYQVYEVWPFKDGLKKRLRNLPKIKVRKWRSSLFGRFWFITRVPCATMLLKLSWAHELAGDLVKCTFWLSRSRVGPQLKFLTGSAVMMRQPEAGHYTKPRHDSFFQQNGIFIELEPDTLSWLFDLDTSETRRQERYQSRSNSGYGMHTFPCIFTVKMH